MCTTGAFRGPFRQLRGCRRWQRLHATWTQFMFRPSILIESTAPESRSCMRVPSHAGSPRARVQVRHSPDVAMTLHSCTQRAVQPCPGEAPFTLDRPWRALQYVRRFLDVESGEKPELDDPRLILVDGCQPLQRFVDRQHVRRRPICARPRLIGFERSFERNSRDQTAPFHSVSGTCVVHQDAAHQLGDNLFSQNFAQPTVFVDPRRVMLSARVNLGR